jgi:death-on-curing protein
VIRYLTLAEVLELHRLVVEQTGGAAGLRDLGALEAAVAQPRQSFGGQDLYPSLAAKVAALGFGLIANHAFVDGNKRVGMPPWTRCSCSTERNSKPPLMRRKP